MLSDMAIRNLRHAQRSMLINHIDQAVDIDVRENPQTRLSLIQLGLLRGHPVGAARPRATMLTEGGRYAVGLLLGYYADALVEAGFLEAPLDESPLAVLQRMKAERSQMNPAKSPNLKNSTNPESSSSDIGR